jgi:hypothetical protein
MSFLAAHNFGPVRIEDITDTGEATSKAEPEGRFRVFTRVLVSALYVLAFVVVTPLVISVSSVIAILHPIWFWAEHCFGVYFQWLFTHDPLPICRRLIEVSCGFLVKRIIKLNEGPVRYVTYESIHNYRKVSATCHSFSATMHVRIVKNDNGECVGLEIYNSKFTVLENHQSSRIYDMYSACMDAVVMKYNNCHRDDFTVRCSDALFSFANYECLAIMDNQLYDSCFSSFKTLTIDTRPNIEECKQTVSCNSVRHICQALGSNAKVCFIVSANAFLSQTAQDIIGMLFEMSKELIVQPLVEFRIMDVTEENVESQAFSTIVEQYKSGYSARLKMSFYRSESGKNLSLNFDDRYFFDVDRIVTQFREQTT